MPTRSFRSTRVVRFGPFELDPRAAELRKEGSKVRIQEQPLRILVMLLEHPGEVVLRDEMRRRLWPNGTIVEVGHGINAAVQRLRDCLGDSAEEPRYVETLARRGYRFKAPVEGEAAPPRPAALASEFDTGELAGLTIAQYRIHEKLGSGGMGVVYRAEDLNLGRQVALKFVAPEMSGDPAALDRFRREARAASALNHPNVCTLYAVEEHAGQPFISMEFLDGRTLEAVLAGGPLATERAVALGIDMAGALDAAHRKGIVHRDFKPGNVMVTGTGVKVLDFGLAKMERGFDVGQVTREGAIMGTLHYMSPEQVQGKPAEATSDIFSFGLVLYEMLAGRRAFEGGNSAMVLAGILTAEPPAIQGVPAGVGPVLRRCLAKTPGGRWQTAGDLKAGLELIRPAPPARATASWAPAARWRLAAKVGASAILALAALIWMGAPRWRDIVAARESTLTLAAPDGGSIARINLSPDGKRIAFLAGSRLYLRSLDKLDTVALEGTEGAGTPFWSPDGRSIAFPQRGKLKAMRLDGGAQVTLCDVNTNVAGDWGPDGTILIGLVGDGLYLVPAGGGTPKRVTTPDPARDETRHLLPQFLPGGRRFLYAAGSNKRGAGMLYAGSLVGPERTAILPLESNARFVPARAGSSHGYLVFGWERMLMAQEFDAETLRLSGQPFSLGGPVTTAASLGATAMVMPQFSVTTSSLAFRPVVSPRPQTAGGEQAGPAPLPGGITVIKNWMAKL